MLQRYFLNKPKQLQLIISLLVILIAVVIGTYLLKTSHASSPYASITADNGNITGSAIKQSCSGSSDGSCITFAPDTTYSGKLLGMNASFGDLAASDTDILNQLGVNSERGELDLAGNSFGDPNYDGTVASWIDTLTTNHIVPLPLMEQYVELSTLNISQFTTATVNWCKAYCAGGSFYSGNTQANPTYAPQILEILNEPYGNWWGYPVTSADVDAYADLLQSVRAGLNSAGLSSIGILAAGNNNTVGYNGWDTQLAGDGGFAAAQGVTIHAYGDSGDIVIPSGTVPSGTANWSVVYYIHQFLANAGLSTQANNIDITEDGWCIAPAGGDCTGPTLTEAQRDTNIGTAISQLATVSWIKGFWYYHLHDSGGDTFGLYSSNSGDAVSDQTPAWGAFQSAAQANNL
jgi:hypothetical protein